MSRRSIYFRATVLTVAGVLLAASVHLLLFVMRPASSTKEYREVLIPDGSSFRAVAKELKKDGIVRDATTFVLLGKIKGVTRKIRAGFYSFNTGMKPLEVIDILRKGKIIEYQVVIPEGYDIDKVAQAVEQSGAMSAKEFLARAEDPAFVHSLGIPGDTLEGYLFPATYFIPKGSNLDGILKVMVGKYRSTFNDSLKARATELGMTEHQVVTLASLIERETAVDSERLLVSAVFHNRLKLGMPLQCDPCVIYALERRGRWDGDITKKDLRIKDPYNTYVNKGLPPGPIANPGKPSIIAALYPANVDYIYFVSKNDGTHYFSNNLKSHNQAVEKYQVLAKMQNYTSTSGVVKKR